jgi:poly-beta-1,6-N-acetyl-D-glucosamine biosynthesis protein PgaD
MNGSPIINARRQLRWQRRLFSDATTALLWGGWLWLCRPAVLVISRLLGLGLGLRHPAVKLLTLGAPVSVEGTALALFGTSGVLLLWNRLSSQPALRPRLTALPDYAGHFGIPMQTIMAGRSSSVCVVQHDDEGRITHIETRSTRPPAAGVHSGVVAANYRLAA